MSDTPSVFRRILVREAALFSGLLFFGFVLMPIGIYLVGNEVFGAYGGSGYGHFFGDLSGRIRSGNGAAWFLVLSPYLAVQLVRLAVVAWRATRKSAASAGSRTRDEFSEV